jgi:hypothetical protein
VGWCAMGSGLIIPQWTGPSESTCAPTVSTDSARKRGFRGPGLYAAALGPPAGSSHPRGAEIMPIDLGQSAL